MNEMLRLMGLDLLGALTGDEQARLRAWERDEPRAAQWREQLRATLDLPLEDARELGFAAAVEAAGRTGPAGERAKRSRGGRAAAVATMVAAAVLLSMLLPRGAPGPGPGPTGLAPTPLSPVRGEGRVLVELRDARGGVLPVMVELRAPAGALRWELSRYPGDSAVLSGVVEARRDGLQPIVLLLPAAGPEIARGGLFQLTVRDAAGARLGAWAFQIRP